MILTMRTFTVVALATLTLIGFSAAQESERKCHIRMKQYHSICDVNYNGAEILILILIVLVVFLRRV